MSLFLSLSLFLLTLSDSEHYTIKKFPDPDFSAFYSYFLGEFEGQQDCSADGGNGGSDNSDNSSGNGNEGNGGSISI